MRDCHLRCDFGYKRDANGCETCACQCVNEENYFDEVKNAFRVSMVNESSQFCRKPCKLGYIKDQFNCFRCECVEHVREKSSSADLSPFLPAGVVVSSSSSMNPTASSALRPPPPHPHVSSHHQFLPSNRHGHHNHQVPPQQQHQFDDYCTVRNF